MKPQKRTNELTAFHCRSNRKEVGYVISKTWLISTKNLHKSIIKNPV